MNVPDGLFYTQDHEWIRIEGKKGRVGITEFAQDQLGDVVFVELPEAGQKLAKKGAFGVVESVKSMSDLYSPVAGTVTAANEALKEHPELVNKDPYGEGWMIEVEVAQEAGEDLLSPADYRKLTAAGGH